jgi:methylated-DNA-[protein]-cysteine S-methyltransferase
MLTVRGEWGRQTMVERPKFLIDHQVSPIGMLLVVCDDAGCLRALDFQDYEKRMHQLLYRHYGGLAPSLTPGHMPSRITKGISAFFAGELTAIDSIPVAMGGTSFQRKLWTELRRIPAGTTTTYAKLAEVIGHPNACRAVGSANGANPISIVVPCHRVIASNGALAGYGGGIERKQWLLEHEHRHGHRPVQHAASVRDASL